MEKMANGLIKVSSYLYNKEESYSLDIETPWINDILVELENDQIFDREKPHTGGFLNLELTLKKVNGDLPLRDYFILRGHLSSRYNCSCIRCLEITQRDLDLDLNGCFLSSDLEESDYIDDTGSILIENEEMEVFFYKKGFLDLKEFIHEAIFTAIDPLPLHDENCKGLCAECGTNLNLSECPHVSR
jgi:uncharacterized protein